jgi:hypothetical protein
MTMTMTAPYKSEKNWFITLTIQIYITARTSYINEMMMVSALYQTNMLS